MAIFKGGVKMGKHDFPLAISKQRGQGILRKLDIIKDGKGRKEFEKDAMGEMQPSVPLLVSQKVFTTLSILK